MCGLALTVDMVTRLADGVWWFDLQGVNAYLVEEDGYTLVDAGMPWHRRRLARGLETVAGSPAAVDRVLVTHADFDHVGGLGLRDLDATVYVGVEDEPYLSGRRRPTWGNPKRTLQQVTGLVGGGSDLPVETVIDGDTVGGFTAYHTPGHTPGHTSFVHEELEVALLGDLVRERDGAFAVPPRFLNADDGRARESVVAFADRAPAFEIACPGHGSPVVTGGRERFRTCADELRAND
jgi:glyoxylase-like metal-dependent hydrolase (beta-lactamase superfamily II)